MPAETVWAAANGVPPEWYGGDTAEMEALVEKLLRRQSRIRGLVDDFRMSNRGPFPKWGAQERKMEEGSWKEDWMGTTMKGKVN